MLFVPPPIKSGHRLRGAVNVRARANSRSGAEGRDGKPNLHGLKCHDCGSSNHLRGNTACTKQGEGKFQKQNDRDRRKSRRRPPGKEKTKKKDKKSKKSGKALKAAESSAGSSSSAQEEDANLGEESESSSTDSSHSSAEAKLARPWRGEEEEGSYSFMSQKVKFNESEDSKSIISEPPIDHERRNRMQSIPDSDDDNWTMMARESEGSSRHEYHQEKPRRASQPPRSHHRSNMEHSSSRRHRYEERASSSHQTPQRHRMYDPFEQEEDPYQTSHYVSWRDHQPRKVYYDEDYHHEEHQGYEESIDTVEEAVPAYIQQGSRGEYIWTEQEPPSHRPHQLSYQPTRKTGTFFQPPDYRKQVPHYIKYKREVYSEDEILDVRSATATRAQLRKRDRRQYFKTEYDHSNPKFQGRHLEPPRIGQQQRESLGHIATTCMGRGMTGLVFRMGTLNCNGVWNDQGKDNVFTEEDLKSPWATIRDSKVILKAGDKHIRSVAEAIFLGVREYHIVACQGMGVTEAEQAQAVMEEMIKAQEMNPEEIETGFTDDTSRQCLTVSMSHCSWSEKEQITKIAGGPAMYHKLSPGGLTIFYNQNRWKLVPEFGTNGQEIYRVPLSGMRNLKFNRKAATESKSSTPSFGLAHGPGKPTEVSFALQIVQFSKVTEGLTGNQQGKKIKIGNWELPSAAPQPWKLSSRSEDRIPEKTSINAAALCMATELQVYGLGGAMGLNPSSLT